VSGDFYQITLAAGQRVDLTTSTPADAAGEPVNLLDPMLRLYDAAGQVVATNDNGAAEGRNATLSYLTPSGADGTYYVEVSRF
jgi:hypothetical protein